MTWSREADERELRVYVSRKLKPGQDVDKYIEKFRPLWDQFPESVRRTINSIGYWPKYEKRRRR